MPLTTIERLLIAPSTAPISIAFAVPTAWEAVPMAMPHLEHGIVEGTLGAGTDVWQVDDIQQR